MRAAVAVILIAVIALVCTSLSVLKLDNAPFYVAGELNWQSVGVRGNTDALYINIDQYNDGERFDSAQEVRMDRLQGGNVTYCAAVINHTFVGFSQGDAVILELTYYPATGKYYVSDMLHL